MLRQVAFVVERGDPPEAWSAIGAGYTSLRSSPNTAIFASAWAGSVSKKLSAIAMS
jgi:hypothetical protein